ncbi:hypothetical protein FA15DRAFT_665351 [Coprinopsis marcescibilis]|uniref:Uncharacterized protein n=1 Tax=Coprinopsis marcescibilis TaxID=230819 RepID=A0A5C3L6T2_COPMA|nr:hypothetical protein FA15DRAFT_665351 [Coprinopsis marcescibilis]
MPSISSSSSSYTTRTWDEQPFKFKPAVRYNSEESDRSDPEPTWMGTRRWHNPQPVEVALDIAELDEPLDCQFKPKASVWIRTSESNWYPGVVVGHPKEMPLNDNDGYYDSSTYGTYYMVEFRICNKIRKYFAPLNGEIKPDTEAVRQLLQESNWL